MNSCANLRCLRDLAPPEHGFSRVALFPQPSAPAIDQYINHIDPLATISHLSHISSPARLTHLAFALEQVVQDRTADLDSIPGAVLLSTSICREYTRGRTAGMVILSEPECQRSIHKLPLRNRTEEVRPYRSVPVLSDSLPVDPLAFARTTVGV